MKIRRLYIKILLSFLVLLVITISLIVTLFIFTAGRSYKAQLDQQTFSKLQIFQALVQETADLSPGKKVADNPDLLKLLTTFSSLFDVKIWISDPGETILFKTFEGPANVPHSGVQRQVHHDNGITLYHFVLKWIKYYATIPITAGGEGLRLHLYYDTRDADHAEGLFFMGIIVIGGVVALLVIPMASFITRRINRLNRSAVEFAGGNLSVRTDIPGHDEIAKLGGSFNLMADRLEKLVQNAKELTANVSHELRSPLARLRLSKELILDKLDQKDSEKAIRRYTDSMEDDIQHLDTLVDHMLTLSKMDYQESALTLEKFSFTAFVEKELRAYQSVFRQNGLNIDLDLDGDVRVYQDKTLLKSVLDNLLDNAVKYTASGETITIRARSNAKKGLLFSVSNPCAPFSSKDLSMLFKPFFRRPGQTAPGTGLGLTITRKLVRRCQGSITATNTSSGLTFRVTLP
ncbi:MAG: HAMP domain-containing histidine kinase [Desulfobacterales bacterium]|nr:HAMP domain-containing histidine kinase [Desulfobacterales bacterium]